jgi:hypothetical protein
MAGIGEVSPPSRPRLTLAPHARERAPSRGARRPHLKRCRHGPCAAPRPDGCGLAGDPKQPSFRTIGRGTGSVDANAPAILCEPALRPCGMSRANMEDVDYGGRLRCHDRLYFLGRRFGSPTTRPGGQRTAAIFLWEKRNPRYRVSMSLNDHNPSPRRRALRAAAEAKKFGGGHFGFGTLVTR